MVSWVEWGKVEAFLQLSVRINVWTFLRDLVVFESYLNYVLFVVTVLCYSVMDVGKDLYGPLDVIDVAKGLSSGSYNINKELNPWTKLEGQNDAVSKKTWQCFNQNVIETLGDLSYLTHKLNNEDKKD